VSPEQIEAIGGMQRPLGQILTEVADGESDLTYMG
jgi:hypothetical protein